LAHAAGAYLSKAAGVVQVKRAGAGDWDMVKSIPLDLVPADSVRTGTRAQATLSFADGSRIELGPNSSFMLEDASDGKSSIKLGFGWLKAFVTKVNKRRFQVKTPTAVCSVRGTEFRVEVDRGGRTTVDLYRGLLGVEDNRGNQVLLHPNERLQVDLRGVGSPATVPSQSQIQQSNFQTVMRKEMVLDMSKQQVLDAAAREIKLAEFQQGKALIDVFGNRVRVEQYIVRPAANQFKLVVLNDRLNSFNYFYYLGTFNTTLPTDLRVALSQVSGTVGSAPTFWLTSFETGRSNTIDSLIEVGTGGHPVDVNNNLDGADNVTFFFDSSKNQFINVAGQSVFKTHFDNYGLYVNGGLKYGWTGNNIQTYSFGVGGPTLALNNDPITGALLAQPLAGRVGVPNVATPNKNELHEIVYDSYADGTFIQYDNYIIDDEGKIATPGDFAGVSAGSDFTNRLMQFNFQQVITASEFKGRTIDIVVAPRILIESKLIQ
jgi:hypothetical protein